ncbi:hypothetical protein PMAYCL1PPCAC_31210, partial [Pristionchus mayeri]
TDLLNRIDLVSTAIMISSGVVTFPPALFAYFRILTLQEFNKEYLVKLFVLNGFSNFLIFIICIVEVQFTNWPSAYFIYKYLRQTFVPVFFRFIQEFSYSLMWQSTFFISLNRYLSIRYIQLMKRNGWKYFLFASSSSLLFAAIVAFPLFFSGYTYQEVFTIEGVFAHYPTYANGKDFHDIPGAYHQNFTSFVTLIINLLIVLNIKSLRHHVGENSKMKGKPEHGLLVTSIIMFLVHLAQTAILIFHSFYKNPYIPLLIPIFISVATTVPFWTLIGFAHSLR